MAISNAVHWEVRTTGNDANGGGFKQGATGVDYSQQDAAQYSPSGMTTAGVAALIAYAGAATDMVGNILNIASGTNFITGSYEITAAVAGVSITVDRNCTTGIGASGAGKIGGGKLTISAMDALLTAGQTGWIQYHASNTYTLGSKISLTNTGSSSAESLIWWGYESSHGDDTDNRPTITSSTSGLTLIEFNLCAYRIFRNLKFTHTGATRGIVFDAIVGAAYAHLIENCVFDGVLTAMKLDNLGAEYPGIGTMINCLIQNCTGVGIRHTGLTMIGCTVANNASDGILIGASTYSFGSCAIIDSLIYGNGGKGLSYDSYTGTMTIVGSVFHGNTSDGVGSSSGYTQGTFQSNVFYSNGGYGVLVTTTVNKNLITRCNAYGANSSGARLNLTAGAFDVTLTGDPFTNAAGGDFSLNDTAGAGAALKSAGFPAIMPGGATTPNINIGVAQNEFATGGSGESVTIWGA